MDKTTIGNQAKKTFQEKPRVCLATGSHRRKEKNCRCGWWELNLRERLSGGEWGGCSIINADVHVKISGIPRLTHLTAIQIKATTNVTSMSLKEARASSPRDSIQHLIFTTEASSQAPCHLSFVLRNPPQISVTRKIITQIVLGSVCDSGTLNQGCYWFQVGLMWNDRKI